MTVPRLPLRVSFGANILEGHHFTGTMDEVDLERRPNPGRDSSDRGHRLVDLAAIPTDRPNLANVARATERSRT